MPSAFSKLSFALILVACLAGCTSLKCSPENCATDATISRDVRAVFSQHPELGAPAELHVQTINGVVYLNGMVNSDFERQSAEALVRQVANVVDVVNSLSPRSNSAR
ncbi:MAG TPA: BON domain-containing protein [Steroidobacteraceae bacterium]|jgi:osmotically-inducible protein OsmY